MKFAAWVDFSRISIPFAEVTRKVGLMRRRQWTFERRSRTVRPQIGTTSQSQSEFNAWLADRRAGYIRDVLVELVRGLPRTARWVSLAIVAASGGGAAVFWLGAHAIRGYAA